MDESNRTSGNRIRNNGQIEQKLQHSDRSASDPDVLNEINGVRSGLVVQFKSQLEEVVRFRRYVRGYRRLGGRTNL